MTAHNSDPMKMSSATILQFPSTRWTRSSVEQQSVQTPPGQGDLYTTPDSRPRLALWQVPREPFGFLTAWRAGRDYPAIGFFDWKCSSEEAVRLDRTFKRRPGRPKLAEWYGLTLIGEGWSLDVHFRRYRPPWRPDLMCPNCMRCEPIFIEPQSGTATCLGCRPVVTQSFELKVEKQR